MTVKGEAQLGKVSWSGGHNGAGDEVVMGNGSAKLDIEVVMGHAQVRVGSDRTAEAGGRSDASAPAGPPERHEHRAPSDCPVCGEHLAVTRLGCAACGSELAGVFAPCEFCALTTAETDMLRVFLASRGNLREVEKHLGVSYPTARLRFANLLRKLGLGERAGARARAHPRPDPGRGRLRRPQPGGGDRAAPHPRLIPALTVVLV